MPLIWDEIRQIKGVIPFCIVNYLQVVLNTKGLADTVRFSMAVRPVRVRKT